MKKNKAEKHIVENLTKGDDLVGLFLGTQPPKFWLFFVVGPLAVLSIKQYLVGVSKKGLYFHRLNLLGKFSNCDFFEFGDVKSIKIGTGILQKPLSFQFNNGRKLKIKALIKGRKNVATLTENTQKHIESNITIS